MDGAAGGARDRRDGESTRRRRARGQRAQPPPSFSRVSPRAQGFLPRESIGLCQIPVRRVLSSFATGLAALPTTSN
eukprot:4720305-Prymnesium_polylepis.1